MSYENLAPARDDENYVITQRDYDDLRIELARVKEENLRLRKIAARVPGLVYIKAKEAAGYGVEVKAASA